MSDDTQKAPATVRESPERTPANPVIYCGPTLPRQYGLAQFRIFTGGIPAYVEKLISECAAIGLLIVTIDQLRTTRNAINTKGSAQSALYNQIVAFFKPKVQSKATSKLIKKVVR